MSDDESQIIKIESQSADIPSFTTPDEFAAHFGWSPRKVRSMARKLGACRIVGNKMIMLKEDVEQLLEATKPKPTAKEDDSSRIPSPSPVTAQSALEAIRRKAAIDASKHPRSSRGKLILTPVERDTPDEDDE